MTQQLQGKSALVTGGSRGIGAAIAKKLAADGARVALTYTSSPDKAEDVVRAIRAAGGDAFAIKADAADEQAVRQAVNDTVKKFGGIDILVNNAGISGKGALDEVTMEKFDHIVAVNIKGVFVAAQEAARHMKTGGRIINVGSMMSDLALFPNASIYTMTKGAVAALTRGLARDLTPRGITVNNVQPGPVDTDMNPSDGPSGPTLRGMVPAGRYGTGDEISSVVAFLASDGASFVSGAQIHVDGALTA